MKIVITGALGYVGSRLIRAAFAGATELVLIDNLSTQGQGAVFDLACELPVRFIEADVRTFDLEQVIGRDDVVVHLAAITGSEAGLRDRALLDEVNVAAAARVAHACAERQSRMLFVSSTSIYGGCDGAVDELTALDEAPPENDYAVSKLRAEQLIAAVASTPRLRYAIARCGTIYGPSAGMRFHTAISKFCWQASLGRPLTVWRTALDQRRPYLDLEDAVRATQFLIARDRFDRDVFNVVTETATVREVVGCIRATVPDVRVEMVESPVMTSRSQIVSSARLERAGFTFHGRLAGGIERTLGVLAGLREARLNERR
jgi:nucleoside-diphosphate-sugar epimerase